MVLRIFLIKIFHTPKIGKQRTVHYMPTNETEKCVFMYISLVSSALGIEVQPV